MAVAAGLESLSTYRSDIDAATAQFFAAAPTMLGTELSKFGEQALERLQEYCLRPGKRIRGSLAALAYDAATGSEHGHEGIRLGVVLELMQGYLLIIDDVMDRSALRRGQPTMHELYRADEGVPKHEADMIAINVGLLAQHLGNLLLSNLDVPTEARLQAVSLLQRNIALTGLGQLDDVSTLTSSHVTEADIIRKYREKTSYYTFVNPLQLGFALAEKGDTATLEACEVFGIAAGIAFQIHDDYLGMFAESDDSGKSNLDDLREGKRTLLVQYAFDHADTEDVERLKTVLGKIDASGSDLGIAQAVLQGCGAVDYCGEQAGKYANIAKAALNAHHIGTPDFRQLLSELMDYSITRTH